MNKTDFESLAWLYFDGEISEHELARLRRALSGSEKLRADYEKLHRLHLATVMAVCGRSVDLRQVPPNLVRLLEIEPSPAHDVRRIVAFAASLGAVAACAAVAFMAYGPGRTAPAAPVMAAGKTATPPVLVATATTPTPAPAEVVGRYAPTSPSAKALSAETVSRGTESLAWDEAYSFSASHRQSPAFGARSGQPEGFDMKAVGTEANVAPTTAPAILTEDLFNLDEPLIGTPVKTDENLPDQPLFIR